MRKVLISLAAAAATLAVAAPASAQVYSNIGVGVGLGTPAYGYAAPRYAYRAPAYGYGYNSTARWQQQIQQVRYEARNLAMQGRLTRSERHRLNRDIRVTEQRLRQASYRGMSPWEARAMDQRVARLRYEVRRFADYDRGRFHGRRYGDRDWDGDRD